ncbi:MAG TPA: substrate-binding domain-containing protein [Ktedonobacterales bacterium]|nr:substrate-binding domain-containing protein [Ktedonobacterales bacterium]HEX5571993.1 substrate-binding domain-containing protein [Ktedonobacterales bacterium]
MSDRSSAIRAFGLKAALGAVVVSSLIVAACTPPPNAGSGKANPSLEACKVSAVDLAPKTSATGAAPKVAGLASQRIAADGSSALQPLVKQAAAEFDQANGTQSTINAGGSGQGLKDVSAGAVQIGMSDVFADAKLSAGDARKLTDHQVAAVVFALVVNPDLNGKVNNLTIAEIKGIFTGQYTSWSELGGPSEAITVVSRPATSGTRLTFDKFVLGGAREAGGSMLTQDNTGAVAQAIAQTPGSIGYVSTNFAASSQYAGQVTPLCIDGAKPIASDVNSGKYQFWNIEHAYTRGPATGAAKALLQYIESPAVQKNDLLALSYLPVSEISHTPLATHAPSSEPAAESFYGG